MYLLAIIKNTVYKLMCWLYTVRYDTTYRYAVVRYSSSGHLMCLASPRSASL